METEQNGRGGELLLTVGLEVHAELRTKTKMFCDSANSTVLTGPNTNICPICLAHPGTLPTINKDAVLHVLKVGKAVGGRLADYTEFDRKNYFYPDQPKGYQISQYEFPLVSGGALSGVALTRIHLEEDTARSIHDSSGKTLVDYNRSGVPLMELVTEPVMHTPEQVATFAQELQLLLRYLGVSTANMEAGEMRIEANISMAPKGSLGVKVEVKNLNSFKSVERAVQFEMKRQAAEIRSGRAVLQETRGWDEARQETFRQRTKEGSADYRYFPDPDLPKIQCVQIPDVQALVLPELPWARRARYLGMGLTPVEADLFVCNKVLGDFFDRVCGCFDASASAVRLSVNYLATDLVGILRETAGRDSEIKDIPVNFTPKNFSKLVQMLQNNSVSSRGAKDILSIMVTSGGDPETIADSSGLRQKRDEASLLPVVQEVIKSNLAVVQQYKDGKASSLQFLVGQAMKATKGSGDPKALGDLFAREIYREQ
ncbi:MAG: Asp-tRNA(Asn)/Glu-tRNA(Gln) amidotransferase subunit GatB [Patescibacteria group bacterium]